MAFTNSLRKLKLKKYHVIKFIMMNLKKPELDRITFLKSKFYYVILFNLRFYLQVRCNFHLVNKQFTKFLFRRTFYQLPVGREIFNCDEFAVLFLKNPRQIRKQISNLTLSLKSEYSDGGL